MLTENEIIEAMRSAARQRSVLARDANDEDAHALPAGPSTLNVDAHVEGRHFPALSELGDALCWVGRRAVVAAAADVLACACLPHQVYVSAAIPQHMTRSQLTALCDGVATGLQECGATLVGGNVVRSDQLQLHTTVVGLAANKRRIISLSDAKAGDTILVSGVIGDEAAAIELQDESLPQHDHLLRALREPCPPWPLAKQMATTVGVHAATDISDGWLQNLRRMAVASGVGVRIDATCLPRSVAFRTLEAEGFVGPISFYGGDSYQLLLSVDAGSVEAFISDAEADGVRLTAIGHIDPSVGGGQIVMEGAGDQAPPAYDSLRS